jgi:hypothetical protein
MWESQFLVRVDFKRVLWGLKSPFPIFGRGEEGVIGFSLPGRVDAGGAE